MFSVYSWALLKGKGSRDPATGKWLPTTENQRWCWWLSLGLIFYNDPLFAAGLFSPSIGESTTRCSPRGCYRPP